MKNSENNQTPTEKKSANVHSPASENEETFFDEYDTGVDEAEIPIRLSKKKKSSDVKKKPASKKSSGKKATKKKSSSRVRNAAESLFSEKKFKRKKSIFEVVTDSDEDSRIKPIKLFGFEFKLWPLALAAILVVAVGMIAIGNSSVNPVSENVTIVALPADMEDYTALVISDLNGKRFGDEQSSLVRTVNNLDYDIILCVGDMVGKSGDPEPFWEFLDGLNRPGKVYFTCGDSDPGPFVEKPREIEGTLSEVVLEDWILGAIQRGAHYVDAPISLEIGSSRLWLTPASLLNVEATAYRTDWLEQMRQEQDGVVTGLSSDYNTLPATSYRYAIAKKFYDATKEISKSDFMIALSHAVPDDEFITAAHMHGSDYGYYLPGPDLYISGHYCGGVMRIPFLGAFYVPGQGLPREGWFPDQKKVKGLSEVGESQVYVTGGLSTNSIVPLMPFRLFNNPEISLITFTAKLPNSFLE